jgi:hypothetical protein
MHAANRIQTLHQAAWPLGWVALAAATALPAGATTYNLNLAQTAPVLSFQANGVGTSIYRLADAATGSQTLPAFVLSAGDVFDLSVALSADALAPISVAGNGVALNTRVIQVRFSGTSTSPQVPNYNGTMSFFNDGALVTSTTFPAGVTQYVIDFTLNFGGFVSAPPFTFDRVDFHLTVLPNTTLRFDNSFGMPQLAVLSVPEPSTLALGGLGAAALLARLRRRRHVG